MELFSIKSKSGQRTDVKEFIIRKNPQTCRIIAAFAVILILSFISCLYFAVSFRFTVLAVLLTVIFFINKFQSTIVEDCIFVFPSLGIQLIKTTTLGTKTGIRFVPMSAIKSVIINESIRRQHVISYLAFILHTPDAHGRVVLPIFEKTLPRLEVITNIYRELYAILKEYKLSQIQE